MTPFPVSLVILTWKSPKTLSNTLRSLSQISHFFSEHLIICQESDPEEILLAKKYNFTPVVTKENIGIQNGLKLGVQSATHNHVLMMENDAEFLNTTSSIKAIEEAISEILKNNVTHIRLAAINKKCDHRFIKVWTQTIPPTRRLLGYLRWNWANSKKFGALSLITDQSHSFTGFQKKTTSYWESNSKYTTWMNRAFLTRKDFFLEELIPFAEAHPTSRFINGFQDLEHPINCKKNRKWWQKKEFSIGISYPGCFVHSRHDRTPEDIKNSEDATRAEENPVRVV